MNIVITIATFIIQEMYFYPCQLGKVEKKKNQRKRISESRLFQYVKRQLFRKTAKTESINMLISLLLKSKCF